MSSVVKVESGAGHPPPDNSKLTPIQKILQVDFMSDDSDVVVSAMTQLASMCKNSAAGAKNAGKTRATLHRRFGAGSSIAAVMKKWHAVPAIQCEGCHALNNIAGDNPDFVASAKEIGFLDAIVWAMMSYPDDANVQGSGNEALRNLVCNHKNADYIVNELKAVPLIVAAMEKYSKIARVQRFACSVLNQLSNWDEFKGAINQADGDSALFHAIKNHDDESKELVEDIQRTGRLALKKLL